MIWLILFVIFLLLVILGFFTDWELDDGWFVAWICAVIFGVISGVSIESGYSTYPDLISKHAELEVYKARILDVRQSTYPEDDKGKVVSGSLTNQQSATELAKVIAVVGTKEGVYNGDLTRAKYNLHSTLFFWFGNSMWIDSKVDSLELLDIVAYDFTPIKPGDSK